MEKEQTRKVDVFIYDPVLGMMPAWTNPQAPEEDKWVRKTDYDSVEAKLKSVITEINSMLKQG